MSSKGPVDHGRNTFASFKGMASITGSFQVRLRQHSASMKARCAAIYENEKKNSFKQDRSLKIQSPEYDDDDDDVSAKTTSTASVVVEEEEELEDDFAHEELSLSPPVLHIRTVVTSPFEMDFSTGADSRMPSWNLTGATVTLGGFEISEFGILQTPQDVISCPQQLQCFIPNTFRGRMSSCTQYIRLGIIGHGACSTVYKAIHVPTLQIVAIKEIPLYERQKRHQLARELSILPLVFHPVWLAPVKPNQKLALLLKKPHDRNRGGLRGAIILGKSYSLKKARKRLSKIGKKRFQSHLRSLKQKSKSTHNNGIASTSNPEIIIPPCYYSECEEEYSDEDEEDEEFDDDDDEEEDEEEEEDDNEEEEDYFTDGENKTINYDAPHTAAASTKHLNMDKMQVDALQLAIFDQLNDAEDKLDQLPFPIPQNPSGKARIMCPPPTNVIVRPRSIKRMRRPSPYMVHFRDAFTGTSSSFVRRRRRPNSSVGVSLVMEYMETSISGLLERKIKFSEAMIAHVARSGLLALTYLHAKGLIHRDVKPENFLVSQMGAVKLADFGIASRARSPKTEASTSSANARTSIGAESGRSINMAFHQGSKESTKRFVGTLNYMSPEQINGEHSGQAADVWSLGMMLLTLAHGHFPIREKGSRAYWALMAIAKGDSIPAAPPADYSDLFVSFLVDCMRIDPTTRPSAAELLVHPFLSGYQIEEVGLRRTPSKFRPNTLDEAVQSYEEGTLEAAELEDIFCSHFHGQNLFIMPDRLENMTREKYWQSLWMSDRQHDLKLLPARTSRQRTLRRHGESNRSAGHHRSISKDYPISLLTKFIGASNRSAPEAIFEPDEHFSAWALDPAKGHSELVDVIARLSSADRVLADLADLRRKLTAWHGKNLTYSKRDVRLLARQLRAHPVVVCGHLNNKKTQLASPQRPLSDGSVRPTRFSLD